MHVKIRRYGVSPLLASLHGSRNALRLQDLHRSYLYLLSHLSSPKEEFYRNNGPRFWSLKGSPEAISYSKEYNRKIQLLHYCIQSWGLSTPEILCMKGRMTLLWSSFLFRLVSELSGLKLHKYNLPLCPYSLTLLHPSHSFVSRSLLCTFNSMLANLLSQISDSSFAGCVFVQLLYQAAHILNRIIFISHDIWSHLQNCSFPH